MKTPIQTQLSEIMEGMFDSQEDIPCLDPQSLQKSTPGVSLTFEGIDDNADETNKGMSLRARVVSEIISVGHNPSIAVGPITGFAVRDDLPPFPPKRIGSETRVYSLSNSLTPESGSPSQRSMSELYPLGELLDAVGAADGHKTGRHRSHSHVTPIQTTPTRDDAQNNEDTPIHMTPNPSRDNAQKVEDTPSQTTFARLDIGPIVRLPNFEISTPTAVVTADDKQSERCVSMDDIEAQKIRPEVETVSSDAIVQSQPVVPVMTKHSFSFSHRRSINLYSPLKSIKGSRSLSDILTASEKSSSLIRYNRARRSSPLVAMETTTTKKVEPCSCSTKAHSSMFLFTESDEYLDEKKPDTLRLRRTAGKLTDSDNNEIDSPDLRKATRLGRSCRGKITSASVDNFLNVCTTVTPSTSPRGEEEKQWRAQTSPCRMENVFTFEQRLAAADEDFGARDRRQIGGSFRELAAGSPATMKPIQRQKAVDISKSLDSCLSDSDPGWIEPHPRSSSSFSQDALGQDFVDGTDGGSSSSQRRQSSRSPSFLTLASVVAECATPGPSADTCSNRFIHRLARRFSIKRKRSKEKKTTSKTDERRGSCPSLSMAQKAQRRSLDSEVYRNSYCNAHPTTGRGSLTDTDKNSSTHDPQNEVLYRGVIRCLLHPLGAADNTIGLRPGDLLDHTRTVFEATQSDHCSFIQDEIQNKPTKVQASVTIVQAKDISLTDKLDSDTSGTVCLVTLAQQAKHNTISLSPLASPRISPKTSPKFSPKHRNSPPRSPSLEGCYMVKTHTSKSARDPEWNERFQFDLEDLMNDSIHIYLCHHRDAVMTDNLKQHEKIKAVKGLLRHLRQGSNDPEITKAMHGAFGRVVVNVKDIPVEGCDKWFDVLPIISATWGKTKAVGQIRLQIAVSARHADGQIYSAEDYHLASLLVHKHGASEIMDAEGMDLNLSNQSRRILSIFAVSNGILKLSQTILDLTVALELACTRYSQSITDTVLHRAMEEVQMTWCAMQAGAGDYLQRMPLCDAEICLYRSATRHYIEAIIEELPSMPPVFPPCFESIHTLKYQFGISLHLLELDLWESTTTPQRDLASAVVNKLQTDVRDWMESNLDTVHAHLPVKDSVIPEVEAMVEVTNSLISFCAPLGIVEQFYEGFGVKYYRIVCFEMERRLSSKVRELMMGLDKYQKRYHNFKSNLDTSCRLSIKLYFAVRSFFEAIKENIKERDLFRLSIPLYQDWFEEAFVFWLQMFRTECLSRIQKALEIDKDLVLVTSLVKYSNSSVDAQTCFYEIASEWQQIDIHNADTAIMGVTKITDLICDGARMYASNIKNILNRNCYYDSNEGQFGVIDRMCITLNNIEQVRSCLSELPQRLDMEKMTDALSAEHEDEEVGKKALATLRRLIKTAQIDILHISAYLLNSICDKMSVEIQNFMGLFLVKNPEKAMATDKLIGYLNENLEGLTQSLSETIFPHLARELGKTVIRLFDKHVLAGKQPEYYEHMKKHLRVLSHFFNGWYPEDTSLHINKTMLDDLKSRLEINSWKTEQLMHEYFHGLSSLMTTPVEYLGHLALKVAYMEETRGNITIYVKVIQGTDLPGLDSNGLSDPYVVVSLQPEFMFGQPSQRTLIKDKTLQPVFNHTFHFHNIPRESLAERGNCILLTVMDRDHVTSDDFAGEVLIAMDSIKAIGINDTIDKATVIMMPLKRPEHETNGAFQVIEERSSWDKVARKFIKDRMKYIQNQRQPTDTVKDKLSSFFKFWSRTVQDDDHHWVDDAG